MAALIRRSTRIFVAIAISGLMAFALSGSAVAQDAPPPAASTAPAEAPQAGDAARSLITSTAVNQNVGNPVSTGPEQRIALVIGNSDYANVPKLPNPARDASEVSKLLNSAGFEVISASDLSRDETIQVIQTFAQRIEARGPNTVALVYYAGHGLQIAGDNYIVPVDARISSDAEVPAAAIRLVDLMATLQTVPSRMRMVMLDACRNNPFSGLANAGRGLAIVDAPNGSIVGYSTAPGAEAFDGEGANSPYTSAFLKLAREPNLPIEQLFKRMRLAVNESTSGKQTPWESSSLTSDFYFFGDTAQAATQQVASLESRKSFSPSNVRTRSARDAYAYVLQQDTVEYYQEYVRVYPTDPYADQIRALLAGRLLALAWYGAVQANTPVAYQSFYSQYSTSPYAQVALNLKAQPKVVPVSLGASIMAMKTTAQPLKWNGGVAPQIGNQQMNIGNAPKLPTSVNPVAINTPQGNGQVKPPPGVSLLKPDAVKPNAKIDSSKIVNLPANQTRLDPKGKPIVNAKPVADKPATFQGKPAMQKTTGGQAPAARMQRPAQFNNNRVVRQNAVAPRMATAPRTMNVAPRMTAAPRAVQSAPRQSFAPSRSFGRR